MKVRIKVVDKTSRSTGDGLDPFKLPALNADPLVSVLIASYNYAHYIGQAIESVLRQTYQKFEVIVCDDGSIDNSCEVIEAYASRHARVKMIRKTNGGQASALNAAYARSSGEIICLLDSDDLFMPEKLEVITRRFLQEPQAGLMLHALTMVDQFGAEIQRIPFLSPFETGWIAERVIRRGGRFRNVPTCALSLRREAAELVFPIPEETFISCPDGFIFTVLPLLTEIGASPEVLAQHIIHGTNLGGTTVGTSPEISRQSLADVWRVLDGANSRLEQMGYIERKLNPDDNLTLIEQRLCLVLMEGNPRPALARDYLRYSTLLLRDDMFGGIQKLAYLVIYGVAVVLPFSQRRRWLEWAFGAALKLHARKAVEFIKRPFQFKRR
ncbi:MAG TPA: glycosyltransferase [Blastocatellia bacterium]|nr:glycosyltransferase [Blastocatellia bacterium]